jgi:hypothetical protein
MRDTASIFQSLQQLGIQQHYLDLAKSADKRAQQDHDLQMQQLGAVTARNGMDLRNWLMQDRRDWNNRKAIGQIADQWINGEVNESFARAKAAHEDFTALLPAMEIISDSITPNWAHLTPAEYVESLYVIAKNASFTTAIRDSLLKRAAGSASRPPQ